MRESIKDYLSIAISTITLSVILFGWASNMLDNRIEIIVDKAVTKAMKPFVAQLNTHTAQLNNSYSSYSAIEFLFQIHFFLIPFYLTLPSFFFCFSVLSS